jgi:hypothetical protein
MDGRERGKGQDGIHAVGKRGCTLSFLEGRRIQCLGARTLDIIQTRILFNQCTSRPVAFPARLVAFLASVLSRQFPFQPMFYPLCNPRFLYNLSFHYNLSLQSLISFPDPTFLSNSLIPFQPPIFVQIPNFRSKSQYLF